MIIIELIKRVLEIAKSYPTLHPGTTWVLGIIYAALTVVLVFFQVRAAKGFVAKVLIFFYALIRSTFMMFAGFVFLVGGAEASLDYSFLTNRLYIETAIITVLFGATSVGILALTENPGDDDPEEDAEMGKALLRGILFIIVCIVFIFTKLDDKLVGFGFTIFKKTIGDWILSWFLAAAVWSVLGFVQNLVQLFFLLIFRRPGSRVRRDLPR